MIGCIYKITVGDLFYIGSTHDFEERLETHTSKAKTKPFKLYKAIRDNNNVFNMEKLHDFEYENEVDLRIEERRIFDMLSPTLNMIRPYITEQELLDHQINYRIINADKIKLKNKNYYIENVDRITEQKKHYRSCQSDYYNEYNKQYRIDNKEKIREQRNKKIKCVCGCEVAQCCLTRHIKTQKHINRMKDK
jgi:hypothetical protein